MMGTNFSSRQWGRLVGLFRTLSQLAFVTILTRQGVHRVDSWIQAAIDYMENLNLFMVALGENTTRALDLSRR